MSKIMTPVESEDAAAKARGSRESLVDLVALAIVATATRMRTLAPQMSVFEIKAYGTWVVDIGNASDWLREELRNFPYLADEEFRDCVVATLSAAGWKSRWAQYADNTWSITICEAPTPWRDLIAAFFTRKPKPATSVGME